MSLQVEKLEKSMAKLTIEVSAEKLEAAIEKAYQKEKGKISVPGFRKGKVPRPMIEKMYGKEIFYEEAANSLIDATYEEEVEACEETIVSYPKITVTQIEAGKPFIYTAEVALKPEIKLGKYKGVKVAKAEVEVSDEDIEAELNQERERSARNIVVEDRPAKDGDMTVIDFEGFVDGVAFEGGKGEDYPLTLGSGSFIPGFEEQLAGCEIGKETEVKVTFPADYHAEDLKGKEAVFKCTIKEIKEKELPELDDEFAGEVSEFDTLAEYKEDIRAKLKEKKEKDAQDAKEEAVIDAIVADSDMEIPEAMIETQQRQMMDEFAQRIQMQGLTMEQYFQFTGADNAQMLAQIKPQAIKKIQSRLVLEAIVAAENIEAAQEDYEKELEKIALAYKMEMDQVREMMGEKGKEQMMADLAVQKAVDFAVEHAKEK